MATTQINRTKLARLAGGDHELIKFFENLALDVTQTIPGATDAVVRIATEASSVAQAGVQLARMALAASMLDVRQGFGIGVVRDASGVTISVESERLIAGILPYLPRPAAPVPAPIAWNDAQNVLAQRIFGR